MNMSIRPVFTVDLNYKILVGKIAIGRYDGSHPCLTAVTNSDKILIHSPHRRSALATGRVTWSENNKEVAMLHMSQTITAINAAKLLPDEDKDILIIGSPTHILAYHVHDNKDIFYKECANGVNTITVGKFGGQNKNSILLIGGNCSIHGYDHRGNEVFWTVIGDNVTDIVLFDYDNDGENELIVSTEDFTIRVFKGPNLIAELVETEVVNILGVLQDNRFAYGVSNGTVGVYEQDVRHWRVKSKNIPCSVQGYDLLGHGVEQLITGWSNGKVDARAVRTGEVLFKDHLGSSIAGVVQADYRGVGKNDLMCVTTDGEVRGYCTSPNMIISNSGTSENDSVNELFTKKQLLLLELRHYESNSKFNSELTENTTIIQDKVGVIPANTRLQIGISTEIDCKKPHVEISVATNNLTIIRAVMIFAEGIFDGETLVIHPKNSLLSNVLTVPIFPPKDVPVDIHIKAFVGFPESLQYHVFELTRQLPRFSMYALITEEDRQSAVLSKSLPSQPAVGYVEFQINERLQRICIWLNQNFLLSMDIEPSTGLMSDKHPDFVLNLLSLRDNSPLTIKIEISGKMRICTDHIALAADLIQSLATFLNVETLQVKAYFPKEEERLRTLMASLSKIEETKMRLGSDVAEKLGQIRGLVIRAEDSRLNSLNNMTKYYDQLKLINDELITGYNIRLSNYNEGLDALKNINLIIQRSSRLRVGKYSSNLINYCKTAIKNNNIEGLIKIIRTGES